ncbi:hypothetical protein D3C72_2497040 [compost metagenome]
MRDFRVKRKRHLLQHVPQLLAYLVERAILQRLLHPGSRRMIRNLLRMKAPVYLRR